MPVSRAILAIAPLLLAGCKPDPQGFSHALIYGNPNKREWECIGKCPPEVRRIEAAEDARNGRA